MSYTPTEWATGDVITAEKLNNMEDGIVGAGSVFVLNVIPVDDTSARLTATWGGIKAATRNNKVFLLIVHNLQNYVYSWVDEIQIGENEGGSISFTMDDVQIWFSADSDNDYPVGVISDG